MNRPAEAIRGHLLFEVRRFVERARTIRGVRRIALIGSLTTGKRDPKDADVLVWVDDSTDLPSLSAAGRQLKGRAQSHNRGADVFLVDSHGQYLGRVCHWRNCRPGIRVACTANHCGARQFVCDDLHRLTVSPGLIDAPPLELWPAVIRRRHMPDDVEGFLRAMGPERSGAVGVPDAHRWSGGVEQIGIPPDE